MTDLRTERMAVECTHGHLARSCEICERDARIAELEGLLHDLLLLDESIGDRLRLPHGWSDEDKRRHALELTAREQKQTDARKAIGL